MAHSIYIDCKQMKDDFLNNTQHLHSSFANKQKSIHSTTLHKTTTYNVDLEHKIKETVQNVI